jgi:hemolysin III
MRELDPAVNLERARTPLQATAARGSEIAARGSELAARGSELAAARGSEIAARGSELAARGSELAARGSEIIVPRLRGVSHAAGFFLAVVAAVVIVDLAPNGRATVAVAIYGTALAMLFGGSALYHRWPGPPRFKPVLQRIDHSTIFIFIAASYTPIALIVLHGALADVILVMAWVGAAAGVAFSLGWLQAPRAVRAGSYLVLGWLAVIAIPQLVTELDVAPLVLLAVGGLLYSIGAIIYASQRPNPWPRTFGFHEIFHALVIAAAAAQYVAMVGWVLPAHA